MSEEPSVDNDALLRRHGLQVTAQRLAVLRAVSDRPHSTADDIDKVVRAEIGAISRQAVYDALAALTDKGLLRRIQPAGSPARYEDRVGDNHHHLICRTCSRMVDVDCAVGDTPCLTAADDSGYEIDEAEVIYWGRCPECVAARRATSHQQATTTRGEGPTCLTGSESENPAIPAPDPQAAPAQVEPGLVAEPAEPAGPPPALAPVQPDGRGLRLRRGVQDPRRRGAEAGRHRGDDDVAGLVAGRLRPLRAALHPDDVARRRHLPHRRRPGRRRRAARSASPRSTAGPTTPTSTRRAGCSGRSSRSTAGRSPGPTCSSSPATVALESMGFKTFGFGFGRADIWEPDEIFWGPEDTWLGDERYSGDRELAGPFGAVQMGLIYVNPEGPNGNPDPLAVGPGHPRDLRPHGDERRGDGRAHRRRPHVRQVPRRRRRRATSAPSPRAAPSSTRASAGRTPFGTGKGADTITSGLEGAWTNDPTKWDNGYLDNLFNYEWELTTSPAGAKQWTPTDRRGPGHRARRARSVEAARADDADDGPRAEAGPDLRADLEALPREPRPARRRVRQGVVQAAAPRHGTRLALPRPVGPGAAAVAGPGPRRRPRADRRRGHRRPQGARSSPRGCPISQLVSTAWASAATLPRHRQAGRGQRGPDPPRAAEGLGGQRAGRAGQGAADPRGDPAGLQRLAVRRQRRSRSPT